MRCALTHLQLLQRGGLMQAQKGALGEGAGCAGVLVDMQGDMIDSYHDAKQGGVKKHRCAKAWC